MERQLAYGKTRVERLGPDRISLLFAHPMRAEWVKMLLSPDDVTWLVEQLTAETIFSEAKDGT